ncbi:MAG: endonuclease MutS2 [Ignavibacteriaceae bacterium]
MISNSVIEKLEYQKVLQYISKYCQTEKGKDEILSTVPSDNLAFVKNEGELVTQAKEILIKNVYPPLEYLPDLNNALSSSLIEGSVLESKKILDILRLAVISRNLFSYLKSNSDTAPDLAVFSSGLFVDKVFEHHIQRIINENGDVKDNASPKLGEIKKEINDKRDELVKSVNKLVKSLSEKDIVREDYLTLRDGRIVIPVKVEHKRHIRGFIHSESSTGQTVYIEPEETLELNNEIISLSFAEKREIDRLLKELTKRIGSVSAELKNTLSIIAHVDSIFARAKYSIEIIGSFPSIENKEPFLINDARHPIILKRLGRNTAVPLNVTIEEKRVVLITGPNAGGKTVVLKTIGLLALMVNSGIHIPADPDSNFHLFSNILVDIGDEQSIEDDLSTFSSHLSNINNILNSSDKDSLVLLDEIGTGTDPAEGSALATAVLIHLRDKQATVFATTHHGSLKLIAHDLSGFENAAMEFDNENLKPTYLFKQGIPGSSYAFEVAKRIGFENDFLEMAAEYLDADKHKVENFLVEIEAKSKKLEDKLKKLEVENSRLAGLSNLYSNSVEKLNREKKDILKKAKQDADDYLKGINKKVEQVIKELKETNARPDIIKSSQNIIRDIKETNKNLFKEEISSEIEKYEFAAGDFVQLKNTETIGQISEIFSSKNKAILSVGSLKMQVSLNELIPSKKEKLKPVYSETGGSYNSAPPKIRIDIRGERPEEAEFEVIKFIDDAYTSGLERIEILHGKGTGALKKTVKDILKSHDKVKNFYFAPIEFGGEGITIAELK